MRAIGRSYMNTYQGGATYQGKIIPIKYHFASLIFGNSSIIATTFWKLNHFRPTVEQTYVDN